MKMFIGMSTYQVPIAEALEHADEHAEWVQAHYRAGHFLVSGRSNPPTGGVIIGHAASREEYAALLDTDPLISRGISTWTVHEFEATPFPKRSPAFDSFEQAWLKRDAAGAAR